MNNPLLNVFQEIYTLKVKNKYSLRHNNYLKEPFCPTKFNQYCMAYRVPYLWNKIVQPNFDLFFGF